MKRLGSPIGREIMRRESARYFERELRAALLVLEGVTERVRGLQSELAADSYYDATEDTRARLGEALTELQRAAGSIESGRDQLP